LDKTKLVSAPPIYIQLHNFAYHHASDSFLPQASIWIEGLKHLGHLILLGQSILIFASQAFVGWSYWIHVDFYCK